MTGRPGVFLSGVSFFSSSFFNTNFFGRYTIFRFFGFRILGEATNKDFRDVLRLWVKLQESRRTAIHALEERTVRASEMMNVNQPVRHNNRPKIVEANVRVIHTSCFSIHPIKIYGSPHDARTGTHQFNAIKARESHNESRSPLTFRSLSHVSLATLSPHLW